MTQDHALGVQRIGWRAPATATAWGQRGPNLAEWACCAYARARARACSLLLDLDVRAGTRERVAVPAHDHAEPRGGDAPIALQLIDVRRAFGVRGGVRV